MKALQIREIVFGVSHIPGAYTVLDHLFWVRLGSLKKHKTVSLCRVCLCEYVLHYSFEALLCPMTSWICQWKPFWIPVGDSFQKAYLEEWVRVGAVPSEGPSSADQGDVLLETPSVSKIAPSLPWESANPLEKACFWERTEAPLPPLRKRPLGPFPERLELPFSCEDIMSGYEELAPQVRTTLLRGER